MNNKIIGLLVMIMVFIGAIIIAGGNLMAFASLPSLVFVIGVGGGFTIMRKHNIKENELGSALNDDFVLAGWLGILVGMVLNFSNFTGESVSLGNGVAAALITPIYGYIYGKIAIAFFNK